MGYIVFHSIIILPQRLLGPFDRNILWQPFLILDGISRHSEDNVQLFQRPLPGFDEEEIDDGDEKGVEDGVVDVGLPAQIGERGGDGHDHEKAERPAPYPQHAFPSISTKPAG